MKLSAMVRALTARGVSEEVAKAAVIDVEDHAEESGLGGGRQTGVPTGPGRGAHGFDAGRQVDLSSDLQPQGVRQTEYQQLAGMLSETVASMKAIADSMKTAPSQSVAKAGDNTALGQFAKTLKMAKSAIFKADMEEDGDEEEEDAVEKAEKLLVKAKKLLSKAEEDCDDENENEEQVEKARGAYAKVAKSLKAIKAERAAVAKAAADALAKAEDDKKAEDEKAEAAAKAEAAKAEATKKAEDDKKGPEKDDAVETVKGKVDMLSASMTEVIGLISNLSRTSVTPPDLTKGALSTETLSAEPNYNELIIEASEAGRLNMPETLKARTIVNHLGLVKSGAVEIGKVKQEIQGASEAVQRLFAPVMAKTAA